MAFIARIYGAGVRHITRYVEDFAELGGYFDMPVNTYSAGMRARLAFGTCLAVDFDMQRSDIILVTHNSRTIRQYCDRGAVLANGRLDLYDDIAGALDRYQRLLAEPLPCA